MFCAMCIQIIFLKHFQNESVNCIYQCKLTYFPKRLSAGTKRNRLATPSINKESCKLRC
ncbi:hypothetical protein HanRHA438_Chr08g0366651 [Helianthus annuus]|nr:hypothetical protein HanRHA438_Chr08g0366651 [Helianthus annuus]